MCCRARLLNCSYINANVTGTNIQTNMHTYRHTYIHTYRHTDRHADIQSHKLLYIKYVFLPVSVTVSPHPSQIVIALPLRHPLLEYLEARATGVTFDLCTKEGVMGRGDWGLELLGVRVKKDLGQSPPTSISKIEQFSVPHFACVFKRRH